MQIDQSIFRTYDIRGIYPSEINEEAAYAISRAFATLLSRENPGKTLTVAVAADGRLSSPTLKEQVIKGLTESGINVEDIGLASTPTFYYAVSRHNLDGGMQVSASHSTKEWNGLKPARRGGAAMSKFSGIMDLYDMILRDDFLPLAQTPGVCRVKDGVLEEKTQDHLRTIDAAAIKPYKVVADPANAIGALDLEALFAHLPCELIKMNFALDGNFPAHEANPVNPENIADLKQKLREEKADIGIATDGDADRVFLIDENGEAVPQFALHAFISSIELANNPGGLIAADLRMGWDVEETVSRLGGKLTVAAVGSSPMKDLMIKENAVFGGEFSGHFFFRLPWGVFENPALLVVKVLDYLSKTGETLSQISARFNHYFHSGEINTHVKNREEVELKIDSLKEKYKDGKQSFLDGIKIEYPDHWILLRASNTEPVIRLILQAKTKELLDEKTKEIVAYLNADASQDTPAEAASAAHAA